MWEFFQEIIRGVEGNGYAYPRITWTELDCWRRLTRQELSARDARTLIVLGNIYSNVLSEKPKTDASKG